jgi:hypothetical protein
MSAPTVECERRIVRRWRMQAGQLVFVGTCTAPAPREGAPVERVGEREDDPREAAE